MKKLITIAILILTMSCKGNLKIDSEFLIIPGESVGEFKLSEKLLDTTYNKKELEFFLSDKDSIINIKILSDKYYTKENIRIGNSYKEALKEYGEPLQEPIIIKGTSTRQKPRKKKNKTPKSLWYKKMMFEVDTINGTIKTILLYKIEGKWPFE